MKFPSKWLAPIIFFVLGVVGTYVGVDLQGDVCGQCAAKQAQKVAK